MKKTGRMKILVVLFGICLLLTGNFRVQAATGVNVEYHSQDEIRQKAESLGIQKGMRDGYDAAPSGTAPYEAGKLDSASTNNGLNTLNLIRYIAGIPDNVQIKSSYQEMAQAAALLNWVNGELNHYPSRPVGITDDLYSLGYTGAGSSNLNWAWSSSSSVSYNLYQAICDGWMDDSDADNIDRLGHRRWCLDPGMQYTGFGAAGDSGKGYFHAMYSIDGASGNTAYSGIAWPARNMPVELFGGGHLAWSFSVGKTLNTSGVMVTMTRERDGRVWNFSSNSSDGYFNVDNGYYGLPGCIVFRPNGIGSYNENDVFHVEITGAGTPVSYDVSFFSLKSSHTHTGGTATCTSRAVCISCGQEYGEYGDHQFEFVKSWESTCVEEGENLYQCTVCQEEKIEKLPLKDHRWNERYEIPPTCTEDGEIITRCTTCEEEITEVIPKTGHNWGAWETLEEPSYYTEGREGRTCKNCRESEYRSIPKLEVTEVKAPKLVSVKAVSYKSIKLTWNAVEDATGYRIYRKESGGSWKALKTVSVKTLSWTDTSVVTGTTYTYRVRAYLDVSGNRTWGKYSAGISAAAALSKPSAPTLKTSSSHKTTVSWKKVSGAAKYEIYCRTGSTGKYVKIGATSKNSFVHKGCKKGTTYTYRIRALRKVSSKPEKYVKSAYSPTAKIKSK